MLLGQGSTELHLTVLASSAAPSEGRDTQRQLCCRAQAGLVPVSQVSFFRERHGIA